MELNTLFGFPQSGERAVAMARFPEFAPLLKYMPARQPPLSEGGRLILESVIGVDERVRVRDTTADPWRKICCLTITGANGAVARGTAWFVGPRTLLTAGHCVYSTVLFGGWAQEIYVEPARDGAEVPFGTLKSTWFSTLRAWIDDETPDMDVGCIQLDEPLGERLGWFEIDTGWDDVPEPDTVTIAGYPVDRDSGNAMYLHRSSLLRSTATQLFYDVDTVGGQSGAPIWMDAADGSSKAIGIHAYGASGELDPVLGVEANYGRRFTSELMVTIASWVSENG